jgi:voltage-gated potassium channel
MHTSSQTPFVAATTHGWRQRWFNIIFRHDSPVARNFDLLLIAAILSSVLVVMLDSVSSFQARYAVWLFGLEWGFTVLFSLEYVMRLLVVRRPVGYAISGWGLVDLLSILPTYLSLLLSGSQSLLAVRILRLLRLFRILKLSEYVEEGGVLTSALYRSRRKLFVFLCAVLTIVVIFGALMYVVEGPQHGFTSIPTSMYWAIVTMATVGFGDLAPVTPLGRFITSVLILIGYSIIAVPTGIYAAELASGSNAGSGQNGCADARACVYCGLNGHELTAAFCRGCGRDLPPS